MAKDVVLSITTNTTTDFDFETQGQGASLSLSGQSAGTATVQKKLPNGTYINITDEAGAALTISVFPTTVNVFVGEGASLAILTAGISGTLLATALPLKASQ